MLVDLLFCRPGVSVIVVWLFLTMWRVSMQFVVVVFPDDTHLLFIDFTISESF